MRKFLILGSIVLSMAATATVTQAENIQTITAKHVETVKMDGKLGDPAWEKTKAYPLVLPPAAYTSQPESIKKTIGDKLHDGGTVKLLWDDKYLYIGVTMADQDVVAEGKENQTHLYLMGDIIEVFLKSRHETYYWETYGTPNELKTCFFFPGRGRLFVPSSADHPNDGIKVKAVVNGTLNNWKDRDNGWSVEIAIPIKMLTQFGAKFDNQAEWTILVARQNYSRYLPLKELSCYPTLSAVNFHLYEDYARLVLE